MGSVSRRSRAHMVTHYEILGWYFRSGPFKDREVLSVVDQYLEWLESAVVSVAEGIA